MSRMAISAPAARALSRNSRSDSRTKGCTIGFKALQRFGIMQHAPRKRSPIDLAQAGGAWKRGFHCGDGRAFIKPVHRRVGIVHRHVLLGEKLRGGRFAHGNGAGQAENKHDASRGEQPLSAQKSQERQQRQAEYGEMIAFDVLKELNSGFFYLKAANACSRCSADSIEIIIEKDSENARMVSRADCRCTNRISSSRTQATAECSSWVVPRSAIS